MSKIRKKKSDHDQRECETGKCPRDAYTKMMAAIPESISSSATDLVAAAHEALKT